MGEMLCDRELPSVPCAIVEGDRVAAVNSAFTELTGYTCGEILGSTISELWDKFLRAALNSAKTAWTGGRKEGYIFTSKLQPRKVAVDTFRNKASGEEAILFIEKPGTAFEKEVPFLNQQLADNLVGIAVYAVNSANEAILLKANRKYLDSLKPPFNMPENSIGKGIARIYPQWEGSAGAKSWTEAVKEAKSRKVYLGSDSGGMKGDACWYSIITPVQIEGHVRYMVINTFEAVEKSLYVEQSNKTGQTEKEYAAMIESLSDGILITDKDGKILMTSERAKEEFFPNQSMRLGEIGQAIFEDINGNRIDLDQMPAHRAARGEKVINELVWVKAPDYEKAVCFTSIPVHDANGNVEKVVTSISDITEMLRKEMFIKRQNGQLDAIIQSMSDGVFMVDRDSSIVLLNQSAKAFFNNVDSITGIEDVTKYNSYFSGIDGKQIIIKDMCLDDVFSTGGFHDIRLTIVHPDKKLYVSVSGSPIYNSHEEVAAAVICVRDLTGQVKRDEMIREQQKAILEKEYEKNEALRKAIEMKDEFLSLVSHELKTPITVINSAIQTMELVLKDELSPKALSFITKIGNNSNRQLRLVNNLLDLTRIDNGQCRIRKRNLDIVLLAREITEAVQVYSLKKGIRLTFSSNLKHKFTAVDEEKFQRILLNLLSNAIKYTPRDKSLKVKVYSKKKQVFIEVRDYGVGIPREKLDLVFERFGQVDSSLSRQAEGMGIGLSLVKLFVEAMGGSISVTSEAGKGSTFTVALPVEEVPERGRINTLQETTYNRITQAVAVELSDIYL